MNPKVSVIVPNYNHARYLNQRIDSILNQTYQDFELILLDDCSTDNSREVLLSYKDNPHVSHIVFNEQNAGIPYKQWKKGIELAQCEWIWIAESDDVADVRFLETLIAKSQQSNDMALLFCCSNIIDSEGNVHHTMYENRSAQKCTDLNEYIVGHFRVPNVSSAIFKRAAVLNTKVPYWTLRYSGDIMFYSAVVQNGVMVKISETLNYYRVHTSNTSGKLEGTGIGKYECLKILAYYKAILPHSIWKQQLFHYIRDFCRAAARYHYKQEMINCYAVLLYRCSRVGYYWFELLCLLYNLKYNH